jgi:hypothetical protein
MGFAGLAGCNAVEDVREEPTIALPIPTVVLQGVVTGLGSERSLGLKNNGSLSDAISVQAPTPLEVSTTGGIQPVAFSFGSRAVRDAAGNPVPYNVELNGVPYGKVCAFRAGSVHSGVLSVDSPPNILIDCTPSPSVPTYDVVVNLSSAFANSPGATVRLTTEEAIYEQAVTPANIASGTLTFSKKVFNVVSTAIPAPPPFVWTVSASTALGGTVNRCPVDRPSGTNPAANVAGATAPTVRACTFTINGAVYYSRPAGVGADPALGSGLTLELQDINGAKRGSATVAAGAFPNPSAGAGIPVSFVNTDSTPTNSFTANATADFQVVVTSQPAGQTCIVPDGGFVSLRTLVQLNPVNITALGTRSDNTPMTAGPALWPTTSATTLPPIPGTRLVIFCRNKPAPADRLNGVYRLTKTTATVASAAGVVTTPTVRWQPFDLSVQNTATAAILTFFDDGTFLFGSHHFSNSVEHGFYDYSATLPADTRPGTPPGRLRFSLHTDTWANTVFPIFFSSAEQAAPGPGAISISTSPGISAMPGALTFPTQASSTAAVPTGTPFAPLLTRHSNLGNVVKTAASGSTPARIVGTAGPYGGTAPNIDATTFTHPGPITANGVARQVEYEFSEVSSINGQFTGGFISQDHRRFFVWDKASDYAFATGVNGLTNLQSVCIVTEDAESPSGTHQRRSANSFCFVINRPRDGQFYNGTTDSRDVAWLTTTHWVSPVATLTPPATQPANSGPPGGAATGTVATGNVVVGEYGTGALGSRFPTYESRFPGGGPGSEPGRAPSPSIYHVAPAASFFANAQPEYFPTPPNPTTYFSWCNSDVLGLRLTLNGIAIRNPVYLCRQRAQ